LLALIHGLGRKGMRARMMLQKTHVEERSVAWKERLETIAESRAVMQESSLSRFHRTAELVRLKW